MADDDDDFVWVSKSDGDGAGAGAIDRVPSDGVFIQPQDYWNGGEGSGDVLLCEGYLKKIRGWGRVRSFRALRILRVTVRVCS